MKLISKKRREKLYPVIHEVVMQARIRIAQGADADAEMSKLPNALYAEVMRVIMGEDTHAQ